jgi:hypothetical protein
MLRSPVAIAADVALVLAADSSGSVSDQDIDLQFQGYAEAITNSTFLNAVRSGRHGRIALAFFAWSSDDDQELLVPWILIDGIGDRVRQGSPVISRMKCRCMGKLFLRRQRPPGRTLRAKKSSISALGSRG